MYDDMTLTATELAALAALDPARVRQWERGVLSDEDVRELLLTGRGREPRTLTGEMRWTAGK